jgi:HEAT repeat protein
MAKGMSATGHIDFTGRVLEMFGPSPYLPWRWHASLLVEAVEGDLNMGMATLVAESGRRYPVRIDGLVSVSAITDDLQRRSLMNNAIRAGRGSGDVLYVATYGLQEELRPAALRLIQPNTDIQPPATLVELRTLGTQTPLIREAAVQALEILDNDAPVKPLAIALSDEAVSVGSRSASALAKLESRAPVEPFLARYRDMSARNQSLRRAATEVFSSHPEDPRAVNALVELLRNENDGSITAAALQAMGRLGTQENIELLVRELQQNPAFGVRAAAAWALSELDSALATEALAIALTDPDSFVREAAASAILRHANNAPPAIYDQAHEVMRLKREREEPNEEWQAITQRARAIIDEARARHDSFVAMDKERFEEYERSSARDITPDTREGWLAALTHDEWETRVAALDRLASLGSDAPTEPFIAALSDPDGSVSMRAAEALGQLGGLAPMDKRVAEALFHLIATSRDDPQSAAREAIIELARWLPKDTLIAHLGDFPWEARMAALQALTSLRQDAPVERLMAAAGDASEHIRGEALRALRNYFPSALADITHEAERVLTEGIIGPVFDALAHHALVNNFLCWRVASPAALAELRKLSAHPYWIVRCAALEALNELEGPLSAETLQRLSELLDDPESSAIRDIATEMLDEWGGSAG